MTKKEKAAEVVGILKKHYPDTCSLEARKDYELLFATRLSAQCTDARVNIVTKELYSRFPTLESLAAADLEDLCTIVKPCGLFRTKAANIKDACILLRDEYGGVLPDTMEELLRFPGVGRKIANLLLGDIYHKPAIVADTHCIRICGRLGAYAETVKDPVKAERTLVELIAPEKQSDFCHRIVWFGREVCSARSPRCGDCPLVRLCPAQKSIHKTQK